MKISIFCFIIVIVSIPIISQAQYPRIEKIETSDCVMDGVIDEYPITIYLQKHRESHYCMADYSVKGWYYYDKYQKKIPLAGYYGRELILYNFKDQAKVEELLNFKIDKGNYRLDDEYYSNLSDYEERFTLSGVQNPEGWTNGSKTLNVNLYPFHASIYRSQEFLHLEKDWIIDMYKYCTDHSDFEIAAYNEHRILLCYNHPSRAMVLGMCGQAYEEGYLLLEFNNQRELVAIEDLLLNSCLYTRVVEDKTEISPGTFKYKVTDYHNDKVKSYTVNTRSIEITENY